MVSHFKLLTKLNNLGLTKYLLEIVETFLSNTQQDLPCDSRLILISYIQSSFQCSSGISTGSITFYSVHQRHANEQATTVC